MLLPKITNNRTTKPQVFIFDILWGFQFQCNVCCHVFTLMHFRNDFFLPFYSILIFHAASGIRMFMCTFICIKRSISQFHIDLIAHRIISLHTYNSIQSYKFGYSSVNYNVALIDWKTFEVFSWIDECLDAACE